MPDSSTASDPFAGVTWHDASRWHIEGRGFAADQMDSPFDRLPARARDAVPERVWVLSREPAGLSVRFTTDATEIFGRWELIEPQAPSDVATAVAKHGLDCYARQIPDDQPPGPWCWVGIGSPWRLPDPDGRLHRGTLDPGRREYRIHLPLGRRLGQLSIGIRGGTHLEPAGPDPRPPIVIYGTSIVHGCHVSRPGMAWGSILSRRVDWPVVNLGFGGNGRLDESVLRLVGEIEASVYVLDCLPNLGVEVIEDRIVAAGRLLRGLRPATPILFVQDRLWGDATFIAERRQTQSAKNAASRNGVERLRAEGAGAIHLLEHPNFFGADMDGTIDGSHPNDLGAYRMSAHVQEAIERIGALAAR